MISPVSISIICMCFLNKQKNDNIHRFSAYSGYINRWIFSEWWVNILPFFHLINFVSGCSQDSLQLILSFAWFVEFITQFSNQQYVQVKQYPVYIIWDWVYSYYYHHIFFEVRSRREYVNNLDHFDALFKHWLCSKSWR